MSGCRIVSCVHAHPHSKNSCAHPFAFTSINKDEEDMDTIDETVTAVVDNVGGCIDFKTALIQVLKRAIIHDRLSRGLQNTIKALEKGQALLCILAENCDEVAYKKRVQALCQEHRIPLLMVPDNMLLGKFAGLCQLDAEGNNIKDIQCSSVVVRDWDKGLNFPSLDFLKQHIKQKWVHTWKKPLYGT